MSGIYGICQPGAPLQPDELGAMSSATRLNGDHTELPVGANGVLLGVAHRATAPQMGVKHGAWVTVDADLSNYDTLLAEIKNENNEPIGSLGDLIAALYARHSLAFVEKLEGAFSLALWDPQYQRLVLAIDRFGFKTLYWSRDRAGMLFASRLGAIASVKRDAEVSAAAVMQFFIHTAVPAPLSIYKDVERLEPGTLLTYERQQVHKTRYWDLSYAESDTSTPDQWAEELRNCMRQAVHSHLDDRHPEQTGAYLSGGTDSSSVVAFASEKHSPVNTFSIYFGNPRYDEVQFSRLAAKRFGTRHHERCLQANDAMQAISRMVEYYDEPFANSSAIGSYHCAQLARQSGVDHLLAGDGGDELFAGNERYSADKKFASYHSIPTLLRKGLIKPATRLLPNMGPLSYPARYIRRAEIPNPGRMFSYNFFLTEANQDVFERDFLEEARPEAALEIVQSHFDAAPQAASELNRLLYLDVKLALADNDLRKVTGTAEMAGVRVRFPLLDRGVAELSGRIPSGLKLRGFEKRYIFKQAMKNILPDSILYKKKHGFGVPVGYWMVKDDAMRALAAIVEEPRTRQRGYFRPEFLSRITELNRSHPAYFGEVLWIVLMLELWHRQHRDCMTGESAACGVGIANAS